MFSNSSVSTNTKSALLGVSAGALAFAALQLGKSYLSKKTPEVSPSSGLTVFPLSYTNQVPCVGTVVEENKDVPLFTPLKLRSVTLKNRLGVSPMCMYSCANGAMNEFHLVHYGKFALGGVGLVIMEATAVAPNGRISPTDSGLWSDEQIAPLKKVCDFLKAHQCVPGIQIGHAGRKASCFPPFWPKYDDYQGKTSASNNEQNGVLRGWENDLVAPSALPFDPTSFTPKELTKEQIKEIQQQFVDATKRALAAGIEFLEIHGAHGYLISEFLSPIANKRDDEYGGSFENRCRFLLEIVEAVRKVWPSHLPLAVRISCTDWVQENHERVEIPQGWTKEESVKLAGLLLERGVDLLDCSSGGNAIVPIPYGPGFQVPYAEAVKNEHGEKIAVATVGAFNEPKQCNDVIVENKADLVLIGRHIVASPNFPIEAAKALGVKMAFPPQYGWFQGWARPKHL